MKKQILAILLILAALLTTGCAETGESESGETAGTTAAETGDTAPAETEPSDGFAITQQDNNGQTVRFLIAKHAEYEYMVESETGEIVDDAVYKRNRDTEELLGVKLEFQSQDDWGSDDQFNTTLSQSVLSGDDVYQVYNGINVWTVRYIPEGLFLDINDIASINLDNPWWKSGFPLSGKVFYAFNDASFSLYKDLYVLFFNKSMIENYALDDPYTLVKDGAWTIDKFISMTDNIAADLNGDDKITASNDQIAYLFKHAANRAFLTSTDCTVISEEDGVYKIADLSDRLVTAYDKMKAFIYKNTAVSCSLEADYIIIAKPFIEGRSLFMCNCLCSVEGMRDMSDDFGIIPLPKYDEAQENYRSQIATSAQAIYIPITVGDSELAGKVCETLAYYSSKNVIPKYYEVALKDKYTRDETVKEMLDIVRSSMTTSFEFAFSTIFNSSVGWPNDIMNYANDNSDIVSRYEKNKSSWQATLDELTSKEL